MAPPPDRSRPRTRRASLLPVLLPIAVLIVVAVAVGSWLQFTERQAIDSVHTVGSAAPDRVDVRASIQRVDAAARELVLRVRVTPRGTLGEEDQAAPVGISASRPPRRPSATCRSGRTNGSRPRT
ncbi:DUF4436 family protein [Streptomyces virginiae]|uniref:DUF4436 family protein n=1 Tax=Streptomyces virginiae TaxID=1961 RepID=UPI00367FF61B